MIPRNPFQRRHPDLKGKSLSSVEKEWIIHKTTCPDMSVKKVATRYNLSRQVIYRFNFISITFRTSAFRYC